jgi:hypothetical protein
MQIARNEAEERIEAGGKGSITLAFWRCSLDVRFIVAFVFDVNFEFFYSENNIENACDG